MEALERRTAALASAAAGAPALPQEVVAPPAGTSPAAGDVAPGGPAEMFRKAYGDYSRGDYDLATLGFQALLRDAPSGQLADDALYYLAEIAAAQGRIDDALAGFGRVEKEHPGGDKVPASILKRADAHRGQPHRRGGRAARSPREVVPFHGRGAPGAQQAQGPRRGPLSRG
jgi:TolA-binding protein